MESPAKKRSLFAFSGLWRSSTAPPADSNATPNTTAMMSSAESPLSARVESGNASAPESPVKRASENQLASRKILGRPQGPSSKLSQSFTAADFERSSSAGPNLMSSASTAGTLARRKPGDNPYKATSYSSSTISHPPTSSYKTNNFSGSSTTPRNIFRASSSIYQRPALPTFSPRVPASTLKQAFPPNTPGKAPRGSTADVSGRGMTHTASSELFKMRIASPPRHLTGEALAKEVPQDASRSGSIYADEFLAHYCPPDLDEHQKRQFFCILDLRRLKYAADDVFTKKDWKINVLNFAKEYEKSRSLIMLRYGLYEFKTVRASEAVKKEWKEKHGIASSDDESEAAAIVKPGVKSKRKAEDDLKSTDTALTASSSNANKRARAPEPTPATPLKTKRKADAEPDENQPSKLLKSTTTPQKTPSATKSVFESIANKAPSTTPAKPPVKNSLFASSAAPKLTNGGLGRSVLDPTAKALPAASTNIFGHLSDASKGSPNDDADAESETSSGEGEEEESEVQEASQSDDASAAASGEAPTPQFATTNSAAVNGASSTSSEAGESTQGRSLFDRITKGPDGQPVRQLASQETASPFSASPDKEQSASPDKEAPPTPAPANKTWNTNTPIKFSAGSNAFLGAPTSVPAAPAAVDFGAKMPEAAKGVPAQPAAQNLFGAVSKKTEEPATRSDATPKAPTAPSAFFPAKPAGAPAPASSLFGAPSASAAAPTFGSAASVFGQAKAKEETKESESTPAPASNLFGTTPAASAIETPKPAVFQSSTLFGTQNKTEAAPLFGKAQSGETPAAPAPSTRLFGQSSAKPLFGAIPAPASSSATEPAAKKTIFGSSDSKPVSTIFGFGGSSTPAPPASSESKPLFGAPSSSAAASEVKPLFGGMGASRAPQTSLFGATPTSQSEAPKTSLFGAAPTSKPEPAKAPLFGSTAPAATPATPMFSFGSTLAPATSQQPASQPGGSGSIFGTGGDSSFTFSAGGGGDNALTVNNPFAAPGTSSAPPSFNFGSGGTETPQPSTSFTFGSTAPSISFGAPSDSNSQPTQQTMFGGSSGSLFNLGGASSQPNGASIFSQKPPTAPSLFGNSLAPGGGTSTGTNSPFTFGGASSLATTPATGTPEPAAEPEENRGTNADGDEAPQEQLSLTSGGPGEEYEVVVHEIRAKALKLVTEESDDESGSARDKPKSPWQTRGIGPLRILKHKTTGAVRMLLRAEPRGHVALNKLVLPNIPYKVEPAGGKYVKLTTANDDGTGLETWMLQVKTAAAANALASALEDNKKANAK